MSRLKMDYLDLYIIHWPKGEMEKKDCEDIYSSMQKLKEQGLIKIAGVSNFRLRHLKQFRNEAFELIVTNQVPYNLLWRDYDNSDLLSFCKQNGMKYLSYASLAQGLLTGAYTVTSQLTPLQKGNILFNEPVYSSAMEVVDEVKGVAEELEATPSQVALKWVIEKEFILSALVGVRNPGELEQNIGAANLQLTGEQMNRLNQVSLEFWKTIPFGLEMWIPNNRDNKSLLERIGLEWKEWSYYQNN